VARGRRQDPPPLFLGLLLAFTVAALPAQEGRFGGTASVTVVEVPVYVVRDGRPVRGLVAGDFEVLDGKTRRPITGFEVVDLAASAPAGAATAAPAPLPLAGRRHFLLLFDLTFAEPSSILKARRAAQELVRTSMHPADLVAVATYSNTEGAKLVLGFTPDREQVAAAIESLGLARSLSFRADPLTLMIEELEARRDRGMLNPDDAFLLGLLEESRRGVDSGQAALVNEVAALTRSFTELAQALAAVGGRKFVVYLSEGFEASLTAGRGMDAETARAVAEGEVWRVGSERVYGSTRVQNDLANMLAALRRADCIVQAVDIGGVRASGAGAGSERAAEAPMGSRGRDTLLTFAQGTGGAFYESFNDLEAALGRMLERTSVTYILTFQPDGLAHDGAFHPLTVRLKGAAARGAHVHHRAGYYAPDPRRPLDPLEERLKAAAEILGGEQGGTLPVSALAVPLPGAGAPAVVPLLLDVDGPALLAGGAAGPSPAGPSTRTLGLEIYAYALDRHQAVRGFLTQRLDLDLEQVEDELRAGGLRFYGELELPPGRYTLRLLVRDAKSGAKALRSLPLEVPAAAAGGLLVSPPLFLATGESRLLTRQAERPGQPPREYPFTLAGKPFVPDTRPVVAVAGEARVALLAYNLGGGDVVARAEVLRAGDQKPASGGAFRLLDRQRGEGGAPDRLVGVLTARGLPPGEYLLRVTVTDRASGATHSSAAPFVVRG